jgi:hypothetical protein
MALPENASSAQSALLPWTGNDLGHPRANFAVSIAKTKADQLLRLADSMQRVCFGQNSAAILAAPLLADRAAPAVQSNILAAKAKPISDKKSLFDTVPFPHAENRPGVS